MEGKLIIFSAPSGSGKSTIIHELTTRYGLQGHFSISATSRTPRGEEQNGVHYHFISLEEFKERIDLGHFLEYQEVYPGCYYGTLKSEIDNALNAGETVLLDIDVKGALNVKRIYGSQALALFILPPNIATLRQRLEDRGTDTKEKIEQRLAKAENELSYAPYFDKRIINDKVDIACQNAMEVIQLFLNEKRRVLLFPGSFNPMHIGHLSLANYMVERYAHLYDEVWFLLTPNSPFKHKCQQLSSDFRAKWIAQLIHGYPKFKLHRDEEQMPAPYYTCNTVQYLKAKYPQVEFTLLIGGDSLITLHKWHEANSLLDSVPIVAYPRPGYNSEEVSPHVAKKVHVIEDVPTFNISSTLIREMVTSGKALPYLLGMSLNDPLYRELHEQLLKR